MPPRRSSRAASASLETPIESLPIKRKRGRTVEPDNEEKENIVKPPSRTRRSASARSSLAPTPKVRKSTRSKTSLPELPETENEEHEEQSDTLPALKKARPSIDNVDEEERKSEKDDEGEPKPNGGECESSMAKLSQPAVMDIDEAPLTDNALGQLIDPPPMPGPSSLPQAIPEEPTGPKSRLVIHKLVLINFKSYAGRQEIGPFHKVFNIRQTPAMKKVDLLLIPAVVLLYCGSQWVGKIQYHRCSFIRIWVPRLEIEAGEDIRTYSQFCKFPGS